MDFLQATAHAGAEPVMAEIAPASRFKRGSPGGDLAAQTRRARACVSGLVLMHRLRARLEANAQAGMREQAARIIGLTARLWLT